MEKNMVYIAGRIDDTDKGLFRFYERVTELVESLGFKVWLPHRDTRKKRSIKLSKRELLLCIMKQRIRLRTEQIS
jgi:hypothetical protein